MSGVLHDFVSCVFYCFNIFITGGATELTDPQLAVPLKEYGIVYSYAFLHSLWKCSSQLIWWIMKIL